MPIKLYEAAALGNESIFLKLVLFGNYTIDESTRPATITGLQKPRKWVVGIAEINKTFFAVKKSKEIWEKERLRKVLNIQRLR